MAFAGSQSVILAAAGSVPVPRFQDVGSGMPSNPLFSHIRVTAGAGATNITFDGGARTIAVPANGTTDIALPGNPQSVGASAACTVVFGSMNGN